ncbi:FkbM family methyltransferase [Streptomyces sp. MB09-02B]|uniref:FkbM family methyltransferase n=1 Tax=Streptomyces sp. MB09-02B TaxID=3028667 RepID=UPI0029BBD716|nr:FkbM family methyltransferase [Streptomyces sp. MB09-02B]MDX3640008.1 FkbM family methyltransferase [Streptomyces sp. MB09-02B]
MTQHAAPYGGPSPADFALTVQRTAAAAAVTAAGDTSPGTRRSAGDDTAALWRPIIGRAVAGNDPAAWHLPERLASDVGELLIDGDDAIIREEIAETGRWEQDEEEALRKHVTPGSTVLDIGAHVGYFSLLMSALVQPRGRVIAVEADAWNHQLLVQNVIRNSASNVVPVFAAAGAESGIGHLRRDKDHNTGDHRVLDSACEWSHPVPVIALDDILDDVPDIAFAKIDLQGADHLAILGMARTLRRCRPRMLVEFWPPGIRDRGDDPVEVLRIYSSLGFTRDVVDDLPIDPALPDDEFAAAAEATEREFVNLLLTPGPA